VSTAGLFAMGVLVTLLVGAALALLVYAAVLDGRDEARRKVAEADGRQIQSQQTTNDGAEMQKNIIETARHAGTFGTLLAAVEAAGLGETLADGGPFTVFAPTDEAFARLPEGTVESLLDDPAKLIELLTYHVVLGRVTVADVAGFATAPTVNGADLAISIAGGVHVADAAVVSADVEASNGLIHVIDRVLLPAAA
jgi:uncharacterized surface protein with fasciclin (FAS1) repeats